MGVRIYKCVCHGKSGWFTNRNAKFGHWHGNSRIFLRKKEKRTGLRLQNLTGWLYLCTRFTRKAIAGKIGMFFASLPEV
jgi:hypothetical protein